MANFTVSDLYISANPITASDFAQMITRQGPVGYTNFARLIPGDYSYQRALIKVAMSSVGNDRPQIDQLKLVADLPDILDRGISVISVGGTTVSFNKNYSAVPDVTATLRSGTTAVTLRISGETTTGFFAELFDDVGASVTGSISWASLGY